MVSETPVVSESPVVSEPVAVPETPVEPPEAKELSGAETPAEIVEIETSAEPAALDETRVPEAVAEPETIESPAEPMEAEAPGETEATFELPESPESPATPESKSYTDMPISALDGKASVSGEASQLLRYILRRTDRQYSLHALLSDTSILKQQQPTP